MAWRWPWWRTPSSCGGGRWFPARHDTREPTRALARVFRFYGKRKTRKIARAWRQSRVCGSRGRKQKSHVIAHSRAVSRKRRGFVRAVSFLFITHQPHARYCAPSVLPSGARAACYVNISFRTSTTVAVAAAEALDMSRVRGQ